LALPERPADLAGPIERVDATAVRIAATDLPLALSDLVFDDGAPFKLGIKQATDGRLGDARRTFEELIANNPRTAGAYFNLALVLEAQGEFVAARTATA
jgi:Flp pilus assembly protein TadD